jgi:hypothetical protein
MSCVLSKKSSNWQMSLLPMGEKHKNTRQNTCKAFCFCNLLACTEDAFVNREDLLPRGFFFFVASFRHLATKKIGLANPTNGFFKKYFKNSPYLEEKKKLKVVIY